MTVQTDDEVLVVSTDEVWEMLEAEAQERLGMSAKEFVDRWYLNQLPDSSATRDLSIVASLVLDRPA